MEIIGYAAISLGSLIMFIGWIWMLVLGFKEGGALWGILIFLFSPLAALVFCIVKKTGWIPLALMIVGIVISMIGAVPLVMSIMSQMQDVPL